MIKYKVEAGIETNASLTTTKYFGNANDVAEYIKSLDADVWFVVEYFSTHQEIVRRNYLCDGTRYRDGIKIPKALFSIV